MNLLHRSMLFAALSIALPALAGAALPEGVHRNKDVSPNRPQVFANIQPNGGGLAPTSWGWASQYSGSAYGTGSYAFDENFTYNGYNSIGGYNNQFPSSGFVNEARGVYVFDISGLVGEPSPLWSAFMLDVHSAPPDGTQQFQALWDLSINQSAGNYTLDGNAFVSAGGGDTVNGQVAHVIDVYNAEDFETGGVLDDTTAGLAFTPANQFIANFSAPDGTPTPFSINITAAVNADAPTGGGLPDPLPQPDVIPTLDVLGKALAALALVLSGLWVARRR